MKEVLIGIMAFLATSFRSSPQAAKTIMIEDNKQSVISFNQQITEYTLVSDVKPTVAPKIITISSSNWWDYPEITLPTTRSGDDLLVLVNKTYQLPQDYAPSDLVSASLSGIRLGSGFLVRNILINDLKDMVNAANTDGIDLSVVSAYRSYQDQVSTYNYWKTVNGGNADAADKISARAGYSQHQLGTAIDFSTSEIADGLNGQFTNTKASKWLYNYSWEYGFVISYPEGYEGITGYSFESWHYRYIGVANAKEMHDNGMIEELYLESKN